MLLPKKTDSLLTYSVTDLVKASINKGPYKAIVNLYPTKYSSPPFREYHCVNSPKKSGNSVVCRCILGDTVE